MTNLYKLSKYLHCKQKLSVTETPAVPCEPKANGKGSFRWQFNAKLPHRTIYFRKRLKVKSGLDQTAKGELKHCLEKAKSLSQKYTRFFKELSFYTTEWHGKPTCCSGRETPMVGSSTRDSEPSSNSCRQQTSVNGGGTSFRKVTASRRDFPYSCTPFTCAEGDTHTQTKLIKRTSIRFF